MTMIPNWQRRAACKDEDPELFFVVGHETSPANEAQIAAAKRVCFGCPVRVDCLEFALEHGLGDGVFGGMSADERRKLKKSRPAPVKAA